MDWNSPIFIYWNYSIVTPCVGVWIETYLLKLFHIADIWSHPAWVCGLKPHKTRFRWHWQRHTLRGCVDWNWASKKVQCQTMVTPCVGVWIETGSMVLFHSDALVTPCVGVWIETYFVTLTYDNAKSHPAWVCGLKRYWQWKSNIDTVSHPAWVCGLKPYVYLYVSSKLRSHPAWVCGLKHKLCKCNYP